MYNDYIICVDEKGQPYIAHANAAGGADVAGVRPNHKYLARFPNLYRMGKMAYAYTQQQLEAMQRYARGLGRKAKNKAETAAKKAWGSKVGRFIDEHDAGVSERIMANRLSRKANRASKKGYNDDAMAYSRRSAELRKESRDESRAAKEALKRHADTAVNSIKDASKKAGKFLDDHDAGLTEALRYAKARKNKNTNSAYLSRLEDEYKSGAIGRALSKAGAVSGAAKNATKRTAANAGSAIKNAGEKAKTEAKNTYNDAVRTVKTSQLAKDYEKNLKEWSKNPSKESRAAMNAARQQFENYCRSQGLENDDIDAMIDKLFDKYVK